jgi:sulfopyruvate decarboxylase subunit beta
MIDSFAAQKVISRCRKNAIVVCTFTTACEWPQISTNHDLDIATGGAMGKTSSLGLGLALAQPRKKVFVFDSDGGLLMNLGSLVTIANMAPSNLIHFLFENGVYRTTGGQPVPNAGKVSFSGLAKAAGYAYVHEYSDLPTLESEIETILNEVGPTFVCLKIFSDTEVSPYPVFKTVDVSPRFSSAVQRA